MQRIFSLLFRLFIDVLSSFTRIFSTSYIRLLFTCTVAWVNLSSIWQVKKHVGETNMGNLHTRLSILNFP